MPPANANKAAADDSCCNDKDYEEVCQKLCKEMVEFAKDAVLLALLTPKKHLPSPAKNSQRGVNQSHQGCKQTIMLSKIDELRSTRPYFSI